MCSHLIANSADNQLAPTVARSFSYRTSFLVVLLILQNAFYRVFVYRCANCRCRSCYLEECMLDDGGILRSLQQSFVHSRILEDSAFPVWLAHHMHSYFVRRPLADQIHLCPSLQRPQRLHQISFGRLTRYNSQTCWIDRCGVLIHIRCSCSSHPRILDVNLGTSLCNKVNTT